MKVFLHTRSEDTHDWTNEIREFVQVPSVGEYIALSSDSAWYEVQVVVHTPFEGQCNVEVFAVKTDHMEVGGVRKIL